MSTRCHIAFYENETDPLENWEVLLYRHSDGYPDTEHGVVADIVPFLEDFHANRGLGDTEYAGACLMAWFKLGYWNRLADYPENKASKIFDFVGHGICKDLHGDIEFFYAVSPQSLRVFAVPFEPHDYEIGERAQFRRFKEIPKHRHEWKNSK